MWDSFLYSYYPPKSSMNGISSNARLCTHLIATLTSSSLLTLGIVHASRTLHSLNRNLN